MSGSKIVHFRLLAALLQADLRFFDLLSLSFFLAQALTRTGTEVFENGGQNSPAGLLPAEASAPKSLEQYEIEVQRKLCDLQVRDSSPSTSSTASEETRFTSFPAGAAKNSNKYYVNLNSVERIHL